MTKKEKEEKGAKEPVEEKVEEKTEKSLEEKLEEIFNSMKPWEKKPILKVGHAVVELVKLPERKKKTGTEPEKLAIQVRLEDAFRGIFLETVEELEDLRTALSNEKVKEILKALEEIAKKKKVIEYSL